MDGVPPVSAAHELLPPGSSCRSQSAPAVTVRDTVAKAPPYRRLASAPPPTHTHSIDEIRRQQEELRRAAEQPTPLDEMATALDLLDEMFSIALAAFEELLDSPNAEQSHQLFTPIQESHHRLECFRCSVKAHSQSGLETKAHTDRIEELMARYQELREFHKTMIGSPLILPYDYILAGIDFRIEQFKEIGESLERVEPVLWRRATRILKGELPIFERSIEEAERGGKDVVALRERLQTARELGQRTVVLPEILMTISSAPEGLREIYKQLAPLTSREADEGIEQAADLLTRAKGISQAVETYLHSQLSLLPDWMRAKAETALREMADLLAQMEGAYSKIVCSPEMREIEQVCEQLTELVSSTEPLQADQAREAIARLSRHIEALERSGLDLTAVRRSFDCVASSLNARIANPPVEDLFTPVSDSDEEFVLLDCDETTPPPLTRGWFGFY